MANNYNRNNNNNPFPEVTQPLSIEYSDPAKLYLETGLAKQYAETFKNIPNHQIRKVLDSAKVAVQQCDHDYDGARKQLFVLVAMSAYNAGRIPKLKILYYFLSKTISEKTIKSDKDIKAFDHFFTSVIAYHKLIARN